MKSIIDAAATEYLSWIGVAIHECNLPATNRVRAAAGCLAIAQDHHHAIVVLLDHNLYASSFALIRVELEAYVRGEWLARCATDDNVKQFVADGKLPPFRKLIEALEQTEAFQAQILSGIKANSWCAMCAYTHTGGLHVQRWNTAEVIEPNYSEEEIREILSFAETIGALAAIGVASLANDVPTAEKILAKLKERKGP